MILCDTDVLIEFYKGNKKVVQELRHIGPQAIAVSAVTAAELYFECVEQAGAMANPGPTLSDLITAT